MTQTADKNYERMYIDSASDILQTWLSIQQAYADAGVTLDEIVYLYSDDFSKETLKSAISRAHAALLDVREDVEALELQLRRAADDDK